MTMLEDIDWDKQARHFLEKHNWEFDEHGMAYHELYPIAEDFSMGKYEKFCEDFYDKAWTAYRAYIKGNIILNVREDEGESE